VPYVLCKKKKKKKKETNKQENQELSAYIIRWIKFEKVSSRGIGSLVAQIAGCK
jgi:hypothetical protein